VQDRERGINIKEKPVANCAYLLHWLHTHGETIGILEKKRKTVFTNIPVKNCRNGAAAITSAYSHNTAIKPAMRSSSASTNLGSSGSIFQAADPNIILSPSSSSIGKLSAPPRPFETIVT